MTLSKWTRDLRLNGIYDERDERELPKMFA
jgi:hypothetical protein